MILAIFNITPCIAKLYCPCTSIPSIVTGALAGLFIVAGTMPLFELPVLRLDFRLSILEEGLLPPLTGLVLRSNLPPEGIGGDNWPLEILFMFGLNPWSWGW